MELFAVLISALSLVVALLAIVWSVVSSRSSDKLVEKANEKADAANQLSSDANVIAEDSKRVAIEAREIGEDALTIARRAEARERDTSNVHWEGDWKDPGVYMLTNRGDDEAFNVRIVLSVDEEEVRVREERVPGGGTIDIDLPKARSTFQREVREYRANVRAYERTRRDAFQGFALPPNTLGYITHTIRERVDWETETGKTGSYDSGNLSGALGDFG